MKLKLSFVLFISLLLSTQQLLSQSDSSLNRRLHVISYLTVDDSYVDIPGDSILRTHLKIELIREEEFLAAYRGRVNFLVADTLKIRKKNGKLRLPTTTGSKTFTDKLVDNDGRQEYDYMGQVPFLNAYLVRAIFWEEMEYQFISKKNGASPAVFSSIPHISPNKKKIITVYADPYETESEVALFLVQNTTIKNKFYVRFKHWMPGDETKVFWAADGSLYLPIQFSSQFWNEDGNLSTDYRYIRIRLL